LSEVFVPRVSCRISTAILDFAKARGLDPADLCRGLSRSAEQLGDTHAWADSSVIEELWSRLVRATENPDIAAEVGLFALEMNIFGSVGTLLRLFGTVGRVLRRLDQLAGYFNNFLHFKPVRIGAASATVEVMTDLDQPPSYSGVKFLQGMMAGLPLLWSQPTAQVEITHFQASVADCSPIEGRQLPGERKACGELLG